MKRRVINPEKRYIVVDGHRELTPKFFHEELARSALREIKKNCLSFEIQELDASSESATFQDAMVVFSRESHWLDMKRPEFAALCEGWLSMAPPVIQRNSEASYEEH